MLMQSFTIQQERSTLHCHTGDRFIPHRCRLNTDNFLYTKALSETLQEDNILKQVRKCYPWYTFAFVCPVYYQYFVITPSASLRLVLTQGNHVCNVA
jgi:hypothetical protein